MKMKIKVVVAALSAAGVIAPLSAVADTITPVAPVPPAAQSVAPANYTVSYPVNVALAGGGAQQVTFTYNANGTWTSSDPAWTYAGQLNQNANTAVFTTTSGGTQYGVALSSTGATQWTPSQTGAVTNPPSVGVVNVNRPVTGTTLANWGNATAAGTVTGKGITTATLVGAPATAQIIGVGAGGAPVGVVAVGTPITVSPTTATSGPGSAGGSVTVNSNQPNQSIGWGQYTATFPTTSTPAGTTSVAGTVAGSSGSMGASGIYLNNISGTAAYDTTTGVVTATPKEAAVFSVDTNGNTMIGGTLHAVGATTLDSTLTVAGKTTTNGITNNGTLVNTGSASVGGDLAVAGNTTTNGIYNTGTLTSTGNASVGGNLGVAGKTYSAGIYNSGTLTNAGSALISGDTTVGGAIAVAGGATIGGNAAVTGNQTVGGTLGVTGNTTLGGTLAVKGGATVGGTLGVTGNTTLSGTLAVAGATTTTGITNTGNIANSGNLTNTGNASIGGTLGVTGATTLAGATTVNNTLSVSGATTIGSASGTGGNTVRVDGTGVALSAPAASGSANTVVVSSAGTAMTGGGAGLVLANQRATFAGAGGAPIRVTGIANGQNQYDAVNYGQVSDLEKQLKRGIASTAASLNVPQVDANKQFNLGIGIGGFDGETGWAVGGSARVAKDGVLKASVAGAGGGGSKAVWGVGGGWSW